MSGFGQMDRPLLFDTQAVVLWATGRIPKPVIQSVNEGYMVYVSVVSAWEFVLKSRTHSFGIDYDQFLKAIDALEAEMLPIGLLHLDTLRVLPFYKQHTDPFDRLIISQAIRERFRLVGGDTWFAKYPVHVLWNT